ncbi:MAG: GDSL-type esterase/lipase family protein [Polaromonas sp.]|nr:GDSL-type esterase/lipase family protein [Polaromonas sp.]
MNKSAARSPSLSRPLVGTLSLLAVVALLTTTGCAAWRIRQSADLARQSEPFQAAPAQAAATLLVVGDSTGVGTGASSPAHSVAGLISAAHPRLTVVNRAVDGAKFADMARQLQGDERFDVILILGGGNDVIRLTGQEQLESDIAVVAQRARERGQLVVMMPAGNVGNAPFFYPPVSWLMAQRSRTLHASVRQAAADNGALYVNLYKERAQDPFAQRPRELNAKDGLHPSDAGYRVWLSELEAQAGLSSRLATLERRGS